MNDELYVYLIIALLPLSSLMLMIEVNPYHALVIRGILGAVAVLGYVVLGAADVALTEALMGTMLAVSLYIIAVRSSFVMRLGVIESLLAETDDDFQSLTIVLRQAISKAYLRLELVTYENQEALEKALTKKEVHGICLPYNSSENIDFKYQITTRVERLLKLIQPEIAKDKCKINLIN